MKKALPFWGDKNGFPVLLAPMAGVTDMAYRELCRSLGCDFTFTEMVSAKGLYYGGEGTKRLLMTAQNERPCGVQLFGSEPSVMAEMAKRLSQEYENEIALIDINMGCPARKIISNGEGCALMKEPVKASKIIRAVSEAASVPVSVKIRRGFNAQSVNAVAFAKMAEESGAKMITVHGRTGDQMYSGRADWDIIAGVKDALSIPVIGNGDIFSGGDALRMLEKTCCDGIMVARGAQGNPFIFGEIHAALRGEAYVKPSDAQRIDMAMLHAKKLVAYKGERAIVQMRKHAAWYIKGMQDASLMRERINACNSLCAMLDLLGTYKDVLT